MSPTPSDTRARPRPCNALGLAGAATALALLTPIAAPTATASDFVMNIEAGAAPWLDTPQSDRFTPAFYLAIRPGVSLNKYVSLQLSYAFLYAPPAADYTDTGTAHFVLAGVRVRPLAMLHEDAEQLGGLFIDTNLGYARTEDLDRFAFDVGLGYNFQVAPTFALGPVVRYGQIVQSDETSDVDGSDAQFLSVGLNFAFGPAYVAPEVLTCPPVPECIQEPVPPPIPCPVLAPVPVPCPDQDGDGICDKDDRCPDEPGPAETLGCPVDPCRGKPLLVLVQFEYDSASMPKPSDPTQSMQPILDAVGDAIAKDPTCRVCIIGHASDEGSSEHNLDLSRRRAASVQEYLTRRGLKQSRMPEIGLGERCQIVPESSRELNRRVEFRRLEEGESCPADCSN